MSTYTTKRNKEARIRFDAVKNGDEFAKLTFIQLRKDDSCLNRILRFFRFKSPTNVADVVHKYNSEVLNDYNKYLVKCGLLSEGEDMDVLIKRHLRD